MLLVLDTESPHRKPVNSTMFEGIVISSETLCAIQLGRISGFEEAIRVLRSLGEPIERKRTDDIEPTYTDTTPEEPEKA